VTAVWGIARGNLRRRWGTTVALTLLVGVAGGAVLAGVAGASRTNTAMRRFVAYSRPEDVSVVANGLPQLDGPPSDPAEAARLLAHAAGVRQRVATLPQVAAATRVPYLMLSGNAAGDDVGQINPFAAADTNAFRSVDRPRLLHGRFARPDRPDEVIVDDVTAALRGLHVGSPLRLWAFSPEQMQSSALSGGGTLPRPSGPVYTFRVVGIVRDVTTVDIPPVSITRNAIYDGRGEAVLTPAFLRRYAADTGTDPEILPGMEIIRVRLRHGRADLPAFQRAVRQVLGPHDGEIHIGSDIEFASVKADRAIHLEALAVLAFAALAGLAGVVFVGVALGRQVAADAADSASLSALGLTPRELASIPLVRSAVIAAGGAVVSVVLAIALSPLAPLGLARRAEIHPGVSANLAVLGLGAVAVAAVAFGCAVVSARRAGRGRPVDRAVRTPATARNAALVAAGLRLGPAAAVGMGMSFERGRTAAFRTALAVTVAATVGVVATGTFGVSLRHLVHDHVQQGWNWDVIVGNPNSQSLEGDPGVGALHDRMTRTLVSNRSVGAFSGFALADGITIAGRAVDFWGVDRVRGDVFPVIAAGRAPRTASEIALASGTLDALHVHLGDRVPVRAEGRTATMRVVGRTLAPTAGDVASRLSDGGAMTIAGLRRLYPTIPVVQFAVRYRPGVDRAAAFQSLLDGFGREVLAPFPGGEVGDLARVSTLPYVLAALLVLLALAALTLTLVGSVRRHRRDVAVLKTVGFVRGQVVATVITQSMLLAVGALVIGVPCGIALGRTAGRLVAAGIGSVSPPVVPVTAVLVIVPATVLLTNLLASGPAWVAAQTRPSRLLRTE
jgi:hypothetical protein